MQQSVEFKSHTSSGNVPSQLTKLERTIRCYHHILQDSDWLWKAFPSLPIIVFQRPRNLRDLLVHANITPKISDPPCNFRCEARRCKTCSILVTTTGERFKLKLHTSCKTSNVIYLILCRRHGLQYVGETRQPLCSRINNHRFNIAHSCTDESPVAAHFTSEGHTEADL